MWSPAVARLVIRALRSDALVSYLRDLRGPYNTIKSHKISRVHIMHTFDDNS